MLFASDISMENHIDIPIWSFPNIVKTITKILKIAYLIFAVVLVCYGLYNTVIKVQQQNVSIKLGVKVLSKIKFPSVTFCHKYKHGGKNALLTYSHQLFEKWKKSGNMLLHCTKFVKLHICVAYYIYIYIYIYIYQNII